MLVIMANDLSSAVNQYLDDKNADGFLYSGTIDRDDADRLVMLIDRRPDRRKNVCLFITTYGGDPNAAYRIGRALKANYKEGKILAILGGYCKSAGTLLILCADELAFGCFGELGPLDTQIDKPNGIIASESGLDLFQTLKQISESTFDSFEQQMISIVRHYGSTITTKVAAEIASSLTVGIFSPISAQIDPLRIGVMKRAIQIGLKYGNRLASSSVRKGTVEKLVNEYPAHGFVIDQNEAGELFEQVRGFDQGEARIFEIIDSVLRIPGKKGIVSDLRTDFPNETPSTEQTDETADQSIIGVENAEPDVEQHSGQEEFGAIGTTDAGGEL
jgi:hypothetical protein